MSQRSRHNLASIGSTLQLAHRGAAAEGIDGQQHRRQLVADLCRLLGATIHGERQHRPVTPPLPNLSPRMRQTLERLLAGDSEKQIAHRLGLSRHTVHVYVKALYKVFAVSSRGELLAKFVQAPALK